MASDLHRSSRVSLVPTNERIRGLIESTLAESDSRIRSRVRIVNRRSGMRMHEGRRFVVFADASRVTDVKLPAAVRSAAKFVFFDSGRSLESVGHAILHLKIQSRERWIVARVDRESQPHDREFVSRLIAGFVSDDEEPRIATAVVDDGLLTVRSVDFDLMTIPIEMLCRDVGGDPSDWEHLEVERFGRYVSWPDREVDMRWSHLKRVINPTSALAGEQRRAKFNRRYGEAIRSVRKRSGIRQASIEGLSERNLRRIELGEIRATEASLVSLANAHQMELRVYLDALATQLAANDSCDRDSG